MHLRRAILLFAIVLGLTAVASSVAPPRQSGRNGGSPATTEAAAPPPPAAATPPQTLAFGYPADAPRTTTVPLGTHAIVTVRTGTAGQAAIPGLGLSSSAEPSTPASFDVLLDRPGRYDVIFAPAGGAPSRVGTFVVRE